MSGTGTSKDRAAPFSRKHRLYWLTITGGMILIGILNVSLGFCIAPSEEAGPRSAIMPVVPPPSWVLDARPPAPTPTPTPTSPATPR
jgi:hypothetical protein